MPSSIINSDDGTVSGTAGLKSSAGNDGVLKIQNNGSDSVTISAGSVSVAGTSTSGADLKLFEDTDNGTNYVALKAPASVASNLTLTLPSADGTSGQVLTTDGSGNLSFAAGAPPVGIGTLSNTQNFTSSGTWTKPGSGSWVVVRVWGGGGGGGRGGASNNQVGGGGGGGAMVEKIFKFSDLANTETVTIGAGGAGGAAANTAGANGGTTTFGSLVTAYGGGGGGAGPYGQGGGGGGDASAGTQGGQVGTATANGGSTNLTAVTAVSTYYQVSSQVAPAYRSSDPATMAQPPATNPFTAVITETPYFDAGGVGLTFTFPTTKTYSFIGGGGGGNNIADQYTFIWQTSTSSVYIKIPAPYGGGAPGGAGRNDANEAYSLWGGAGGGGGRALGTAAGGIAYYLGNGANILGGTGQSGATTGGTGSQPACGGGGGEQGNGGNGGAGQCTVWVFN